MATSTAIRKDRHIETSILGELLSANRAASGLTLEALSSRSGFAVDQIVDVESGRHDLEAPALERLLANYEIPAMIKSRSRLSVEISLDGGWVCLGAGRRSGGKLPEADQNLLSYLCLVYDDRDLSLDDRIPLKSVDLSLLRASLALRRPEVRSRLDRQRNGVPARLRQNRSLLAVATAAGVAVVAGAIILVPAVRSSNTATPETSPIDAVSAVLTEPAVGPIDTPFDTAPVIDPRIDIGTAVVMERGPDSWTADGDPWFAPVPAPDPDDRRIRLRPSQLAQPPVIEVEPSAETTNPNPQRGPPGNPGGASE